MNYIYKIAEVNTSALNSCIDHCSKAILDLNTIQDFNNKFIEAKYNLEDVESILETEYLDKKYEASAKLSNAIEVFNIVINNAFENYFGEYLEKYSPNDLSILNDLLDNTNLKFSWPAVKPNSLKNKINVLKRMLTNQDDLLAQYSRSIRLNMPPFIDLDLYEGIENLFNNFILNIKDQLEYLINCIEKYCELLDNLFKKQKESSEQLGAGADTAALPNLESILTPEEKEKLNYLLKIFSHNLNQGSLSGTNLEIFENLKKINDDQNLLNLFKFYGYQILLGQPKHINKINKFVQIYEEHPEIISNPEVKEIYKVPQFSIYLFNMFLEGETINNLKKIINSAPIILSKVNKATQAENTIGSSPKELFLNLIHKSISDELMTFFIKTGAQPEYDIGSILRKMNAMSFIEKQNQELQTSKTTKSFEVDSIAKLFARYLDFPNKEKFAKLFFEKCYYMDERNWAMNNPNFGLLINFIVKNWNKDINFAPKLAEMYCLNPELVNLNSEINKSWNSNNIFLNLILDKKISCSNFNQLFSNFKQFKFIARKIHNVYGDGIIGSDEYLNIIITFMKGRYDINSDVLDKAIDIALNKSFLTTENLEQKCFNLDIDYQDAIKKFVELQAQFKNGNLSLNKQIIYRLDNQIKLIETYDSVQEYKQYKKDKVPELYKLNYTVNDKLKFEVLANNSLEYFTVGADTGCCQRIKQPGAVACVDSYINPLAGVLTLKLIEENEIVSQSYFHYVPEDNGYILDNVEPNNNLVKKLQINLDTIYASLAAQVKADHNVAYFRCGKRFNKLSEENFESNSLKTDKRTCDVSDLNLRVPVGPEPHDYSSKMYSDYNKEDHLDLLKSKVIYFPLESRSVEKISNLSENFLLQIFGILNK